MQRAAVVSRYKMPYVHMASCAAYAHCHKQNNCSGYPALQNLSVPVGGITNSLFMLTDVQRTSAIDTGSSVTDVHRSPAMDTVHADRCAQHCRHWACRLEVAEPADGSELGGRDPTQVHHGVKQPPVIQLHHKLSNVKL